MLVAALVDAGVPTDVVTDAVAAVGLDVTLEFRETKKGALRALSFDVASSGAVTHRTYTDIVTMIRGGGLTDSVSRRAVETFTALAYAEAKVHNTTIESVHFHEVGADDAIADIVGACAALEYLAPQRVVVSPIATGRGTTGSMHGTIPVPAPAVLEILAGAAVEQRGNEELVTPTGAALLASWADNFGDMPSMTLRAVGYGGGTKEFEWPNVVRVIVGDIVERSSPSIATELLETNIDDMSPELIPFVIERVIDAGALDAWSTPVQMKKGRIGILLSVLVERGASQQVLDVIFRETTTFGVRISEVDRATLDRKVFEVDVSGHMVRVKVGYRDGEVVTTSPEYEDAARVARATGMPLRDVYRAALKNLSI